ncbi:MAG TPA: homoserine O-succinyltransferase, partial [Lachnospiraceae bacterium]|nr:homoserine O-succinyltransferase [Lachnospiraceae bacterium]
SNTPLQVDVTFLMVKSHVSVNTSRSHLSRFYTFFDDIKEQHFDGMIITGAPVEQMPFEQVDYWDEICHIMEWTKTHVTSTLHICWGAQAGLYYHFGLQKTDLSEKLFGIYPHKVARRTVPLVRGFDDIFYAPHSRHTTVQSEAIHACKELVVLAESELAGVLLCMTEDGKQIFIMGHLEYDRYTLEKEYRRDVEKNLPIHVPLNYYPEDDPTKKPLLQWRSHRNNLYSNWLNYYVYQQTPFEWKD